MSIRIVQAPQVDLEIISRSRPTPSASTRPAPAITITTTITITTAVAIATTTSTSDGTPEASSLQSIGSKITASLAQSLLGRSHQNPHAIITEHQDPTTIGRYP